MVSVLLGANGSHAATGSRGAFPPEGDAPRDQKMADGHWASGLKQFFGTAYQSYDSKGAYDPQTALSKVWFTGAQGILSEVYWPTVDRAQVVDSQFLVSDGKSFLFEERRNAVTEIRWVRPGVPEYIVLNKDPQNRFTIQKTFFADPERNVVLVKVRIVRNVAGLKFYYLHHPAVANTPFGDTAYANNTNLPGLYAWQDNEAQALIFSVPMLQVSAGFSGSSDGYQDLVNHYTMDAHFEYAHDGNTALTAHLDLPDNVGVSEFTVALGFGTDFKQARQAAALSLNSVDASEQEFIQRWENYQASLTDYSSQSLDGGSLFRASVALLKSSEDKTSAGAFVASPTIPWGLSKVDNNAVVSRAAEMGGYHLVWPRDLYQISTALLSVGDAASAKASLNYLKKIQFTKSSGLWDGYGSRVIPKDGGFPQNCWINGTPFWNGLQMDQVAYPILLAYRLWKNGDIQVQDYRGMLTRAADLIQKFGPWSSQERWEENYGASPSTIASEITALWSVSEMLRTVGLEDKANVYQATADAWSVKSGDNIDTWTFTETGGLGGGKYYVRITGAGTWDEKWDPNSEARFDIQNGGGSHREKDIIDGGFLELVRLGVRKPSDYHVLQTVHEYDRYLRTETKRGPGFYRYLDDNYNYDEGSGQRTKGMLWPLLTGERGHYELQLALEQNLSALDVDSAVNPYISAIENFATPSLMIPEQVWDAGPGEGLSTGSATPLGWSHAEYIKLLASKGQKKVVDLIPEAAERSAFLMKSHP